MTEEKDVTGTPGNKKKKIRPKLTVSEITRRYHNYFLRTGRYRFIIVNLLRVIAIIAIFSIGAWLITTYVVDLDSLMKGLSDNLDAWVIVSVLFLSESFFGVLPPDFFIFWAKTLENPYTMVFILSLASYGGGIISYFIGTKLYKLPAVKKWVHIKFANQFLTFRKFGGLLLFISALTPLPFSWVSIVCGVVKYPFGRYTIIATSRIARFFAYAFIFYQFV